MSSEKIEDLRARYRVPDSVRLSAPEPNDRVTSSQSGGVALYEKFFKGGLCLPFHSFILNLLDRYDLVPA